MHPSEFATPGKIPPVLTGTAGVMPAPFEQWDPEGDVAAHQNGAEVNYVPSIVRAPPQLPRPEQHPNRAEFAPRGYERFFTATAGLASVGLNHQLGFTAHSVRVDNYSSHWVYLNSAGVYVPPFIYGAIVQIQPGVINAQFTLSPPQGYTDPTPVLDSTVVTIWLEDWVPNSPGVPIASSFRQGASGGAVVTGPLTIQGTTAQEYVGFGTPTALGMSAYDPNTLALRGQAGWGLNLGGGFIRIATARLAWGTDFNNEDVALQRVAAGVLALSAGTLRLSTLPAFVSGDHYVVADAAGNLHLSSLGPAS